MPDGNSPDQNVPSSSAVFRPCQGDICQGANNTKGAISNFVLLICCFQKRFLYLPTGALIYLATALLISYTNLILILNKKILK